MGQVLSDRQPQIRQLLGEADQLLELRRLLLRAEVRVIAVLEPPGAVDAGRLELGPRPRRDPDVLPRRRDCERVQPRDHLGVADPAALRVEVAERPAAPLRVQVSRDMDFVFATRPASIICAPMDANAIVVLEGDQTGQELLEEALRVLAPDVIGLELEFPRFDLSLENRRATQNAVVHEAARAIREHGLGLKAATITPEGTATSARRTGSCARRSAAA